MKRHTIEFIKFEFRQARLNEPYVLFAWFGGDEYVCLVPFRLKMSAKDYIVEAIDHFTGLAHLESDWELRGSNCPTFIEAQARMSFDLVADTDLDPLPM